jgi:hypothetical protein
MAISHLEVIVEEPSMETALRQLLPGMLGDEITFDVYPHQGKSELLDRLPDRLRGYSRFIPDGWKILVVVDRDDEVCEQLKEKLEQMAFQSGLATRSANPEKYVVVNRIAVEELEAWYFGDWEAVREVYPKLPSTVPNKAGYRNPDQIAGGTWEAFERVCQKAGYFKNGLRKIEAATMIAPKMVPSRNTSHSFQALRDVVAEMTV